MCLRSQVYSESESGDSGEGEAGGEGDGGVRVGAGNDLLGVAGGATNRFGCLDVGNAFLGASDLGVDGVAVSASL